MIASSYLNEVCMCVDANVCGKCAVVPRLLWKKRCANPRRILDNPRSKMDGRTVFDFAHTGRRRRKMRNGPRKILTQYVCSKRIRTVYYWPGMESKLIIFSPLFSSLHYTNLYLYTRVCACVYIGCTTLVFPLLY